MLCIERIDPIVCFGVMSMNWLNCLPLIGADMLPYFVVGGSLSCILFVV